MLNHLKSRGWKDQKVWIGEVATFPLYKGGVLKGILIYDPKGVKKGPGKPKYQTISREPIFWGTERPLVPGPLFLVEGIFKAIKVQNLGFNCWATLTDHVHKSLFEQLRFTGRKVYWIGDDDKAGKRMLKTFPGTTSQDLDELSDPEVLQVLERATK